ncbi:AAA family ATPase [Spirulina subsalsa FACHB-351]|uniref:AAA family ATPase n=1 Tax=Spirulina subsalsa FACHB-351 TaxID=234711 RepID=A0ABT3L1L8_9CYAN|nr:NB-ARC domain-containing protein [Spirulina subsalsa]MCW6035403.1 AAA family ATPase [Spirulina subsalsa FACHB-351]
MSITEVLQLVDRLVQKQTGEHLDDLQKEIIQGIWEGKTYQKIAEDSTKGYNENYIGDVSRKLFEILSEQLDEPIKKSNFCWTIERIVNSQAFGLVNANIRYCPYHPPANPPQPIPSPETPYPLKKYQDLTLAPKIHRFCDRTTELHTLSSWLCDKKIPLISVLGIAGIGKTTLVKRVVDLNQEQFDFIVWKPLKLCPSFPSLIRDILTHSNPYYEENDHQLTQLFDLFRQQRCLIVLDDLQEIFVPGKGAGQYKMEHRDYKTLLTMLTHVEHQSSLIVISQEQCPEMMELDEELYPIQALELEGLENTDILKNLGLKDRQNWCQLMALYEGHPMYLKAIARVINKVFLGKVSDFLAENRVILTDEMKDQFRDLFQRLSPIEQQIALRLTEFEQPIDRNQLNAELSLPSPDLINGLQCLQRRYLIKSITTDAVYFGLSSVFREYLLADVLN